MEPSLTLTPVSPAKRENPELSHTLPKWLEERDRPLLWTKPLPETSVPDLFRNVCGWRQSPELESTPISLNWESNSGGLLRAEDTGFVTWGAPLAGSSEANRLRSSEPESPRNKHGPSWHPLHARIFSVSIKSRKVEPKTEIQHPGKESKETFLTMGGEREGKHLSDPQRSLPSLPSGWRVGDLWASLCETSFTRWRFNDHRPITKWSFAFFLGMTNSKLLNPGDDLFDTLSMAPFSNTERILVFRCSLLLLSSGSKKGIGLVVNRAER